MKKNRWIFTITFFAFIITIVFSVLSDIVLSETGLIFGILIILLFISLGVVFDMVGISVASCKATSFHSMASRRVTASKTAIKLIKNSHKVSSFCNDVIGDICNIMSGTAGVVVTAVIAVKYELDYTIVLLIVTSLIASLTIGGKAFGKDIAIKNNEKIVFRFAEVLSLVKKSIKK